MESHSPINHVVSVKAVRPLFRYAWVGPRLLRSKDNLVDESHIVERERKEDEFVAITPPLYAVEDREVSALNTAEVCFQPLASNSDVGMRNMQSTEVAGCHTREQNECDPECVSMEDLLPQIVKSRGSVKSPDASSEMAASKATSTTPELFHAIMRMIGLAEGGVIVNRNGPEFEIAVADANYGIQLNNCYRLVYTRQFGLQVIDFTD